MAQTGVATLHDLLGGALPGRIHLLTGAPGSGKTSACLSFLRAGIVRGERSALLTLDRPADLHSHATYCGQDLRNDVRDGRLSVIRYDARFADRVAAAASPSAMLAELRQLFVLADLRQMYSQQAPLRIGVDTIAPFLASGVTTGAALDTLVGWLEETGATAVLTWHGDISAALDRRMERLVERAAVILKFRRSRPGVFRAEVVRARHPIANSPPIELTIEPRRGLVPVSDATDMRSQQSVTLSALPIPDILFADGDREQPPA